MALHEQNATPKATGPTEISDEDRSKDKFFHDVAKLSDAMIAAHGREFAMGTLILAARFIAENKAFTKPAESAACGSGCSHDGEHNDHKT